METFLSWLSPFTKAHLSIDKTPQSESNTRTLSKGNNDRHIMRDKQPLRSVCKQLQPVVLVHGGAGTIPDSVVPEKLNCVKRAAIAGYRTMREGGTPADAVEAAIRVMEDDPIMNAGYGSVLNYEGEVEVDACIMVGKSLDTGGVTAVTDIANPISLAKMVMEKSPHTLLAGEGAKKFAKENDYPIATPGSLATEQAKRALEVYKSNPNNELGLDNFDEIDKSEHPVWPKTESLGAVAMNHKGEFAAGACTGGWMAKTRGKFSETCAVGGGIYADDRVGALSLAGDGKYMLRMMLALQIAKDMEKGRNPYKASKDWLRTMWCKFGENGGAVGVSKYGDIGVYFNTGRMPWAYQVKNILHFGIERDQDLKEIVC